MLLATAFGAALSAQETAGVASPSNILDGLTKECERDYRAWVEVERASRTGKEKEVAARERPDPSAWAARFRDFADAHRADPSAIEALYRAIGLFRQDDRANREAMESVFDRLKTDWAGSPALAKTFPRIGVYGGLCKGSVPFLREVVAKNPSREVRGHAEFALAGMLDRHSRLSVLAAESPQTRDKLEAAYGKENLESILKIDADRLAAESVTLAEHVAAEYADVPWWLGLPPGAPKPRTLGSYAADMLARERETAVGRRMPEIVGEDVGGEPLRLSDYRGKVVVIVFWASWCGPCMAMLPHERELVARHKDRPFALIGVSVDRTREDARAVVEREKPTWPSWFDGERKISERLHIDGQGIPRVYVLDAEGVIRFKDVRAERLDKAVDSLLQPGR
ncbi:TlpA family protein disulfide reductase [Paludisphaera mucosa]|uniref:TlpA disulfide reductase family protein n=1 Tax=Paludisphaera mucosa TaxID=3030827 RepID=A0ABT6F3L7_9BACT|nr:TlpA disulfide reductase family protein [Paludisphaera mucosa]MDG3002163.1 TlpA disulfide reductase family protein [Paludisphaera mucosa]